jgi:hypothetical protein
VRNYKQYVKKFGKKKGEDERVVEAYLRIGELSEASGAKAPARHAYLTAVGEAVRRKAGQSFGAKAQFLLAEQAFAEYDAINIDGSTRAQKAAITKRAGALTKVRDTFQKVFPFKQVEWTLAALYRIGNLYETFSDKLFAAPPPPEIRRLGPEYIEEYRVLLEEQAGPVEDKAVEAYKRVVAEAKKSGVVGDWTKRTLKSLNKLRKKEFPLQKEARYQFENSGIAPPGLVQLANEAEQGASQPASVPVNPASQPSRQPGAQ